MVLLIEILAFIVPTAICLIIGDLQATYGPDWREGRRRYKAWCAERDRLFEEGRRQWAAGEYWPRSVWWPPRDMAWDGSCPRLGLESHGTTEARERWPAWFARHGVNAPEPTERP